jgi:putative transposase
MVGPGEGTVCESGALGLSDAAWAVARHRGEVIVPLAEMAVVPVALAEAAAGQLGLSRRTVYTLIRCYRDGGGSLAKLAPGRPHGGRGRSRLPEAVERIVADVIARQYLSRQKRKAEAVVREVGRRCRAAGVKAPSANTVRARIAHLRPELVVRRREGSDAARRLEPAAGRGPEANAPLDVVQIDHTPVDLIVVDPFTRQPIGRPWLTVAIDVFSRAIVGLCLSLEAPSAVSVGLCLAHGVIDKRSWLERLGVDADWPVQGKPRCVHVDNGAEFHSEALHRGCDVHGIRLLYRPVGTPHFGGVIERVISTFMTMVHELPGTTFSSIAERGAYEADREAALTLAELERWLALAIAGPYHNAVHTGIDEPPLACWRRGVAQAGEPSPVGDPKAFLVDFLPVVRRRIQRQGIVIDHVAYFSNALIPWIADRDRGHRFLIRRDPRDLSRIWVLPPDQDHYLEIPYRTLSNPAVTLWEHRQAVARLRKAGREAVNETAIFRAVEHMRAIIDRAVGHRRAARREQARRAHLKEAPRPAATVPPEQAEDRPAAPVKPFSDIEEW